MVVYLEKHISILVVGPNRRSLFLYDSVVSKTTGGEWKLPIQVFHPIYFDTRQTLQNI